MDEVDTEPLTSEVLNATLADDPSPIDEAGTEPPTLEVPGEALTDDPISMDMDAKPFTPSATCHDPLDGVSAPVGLDHGHIKEMSSHLGSTVKQPGFSNLLHSTLKRPRSPTPPIELTGTAKHATSPHPMKKMKTSHAVSSMSSHGQQPTIKPHVVSPSQGSRSRLEQDSIHTGQDARTDHSNCIESMESSAQLGPIKEVDVEGGQAIHSFTFRFLMPQRILMGAMATLHLAGQEQSHEANTSPHTEHNPDLNDGPFSSLPHDVGSNAQQNESTSNGLKQTILICLVNT
ncbi:hypothetical protein F5J12DRAFT_894780 [Pisolithus orientalis]|uniref:uncharacterized protein n=1 Tax=Pisolithus orientalis TaxID=936130 RepID=UPI00222417E3|nr:uncharacterized protein F5J12DRAFT_894780 [Pisolithus orientalis]KAI6000327.1 hypothetical protein F5J12DRAFT_894780 [Pisolithus orientalis]